MKHDSRATDAKYANCYKPDRRQKDNNLLIREALRQYGLHQWQLAEMLGMREEALSRMLRHELPIAEQNELIKIIRKEG